MRGSPLSSPRWDFVDGRSGRGLTLGVAFVQQRRHFARVELLLLLDFLFRLRFGLRRLRRLRLFHLVLLDGLGDRVGLRLRFRLRRFGLRGLRFRQKRGLFRGRGDLFLVFDYLGIRVVDWLLLPNLFGDRRRIDSWRFLI